MPNDSPSATLTSARRFAAIIEHSEDAIISVSLDGRITSWNYGATLLFGYTAEAMIGAPIARLYPPDISNSGKDGHLERSRRGERVSHFETQRLRSDGTLIDISLTVSPIRDETGAVVGTSKIARDITARKRAEKALGKLIECSRLVGRPFLDAIVEGLAEALDVRWVLLCDLHPETPGRARVLSAWSDGRRQESFEYDLKGTPCANAVADGLCYYPSNVADLFPDDSLLADMGAESYLGTPLRGAGGKALGLLAILHDKPIDSDRRPEETLELFAGRVAAELQRMAATGVNERLGRIVEDAASEVFVFDAQSLKFILINRGARDNLGFSMAELRQMTPVDIKPLVSAEAFEELVKPLRSGEKAVQAFETVHRRKDGTEYIASVKLQLLEDEERPVFYAAIEDVTERDATMQALRQVSQRLDSILNNTTMAVFLMDDRQHCSYMNPAAERLTGYRLEDTLGRPLHDVIHHTHPDGTPYPLHDCPIDRAFLDQNQVQGEDTFIHKDGSFLPVAFSASPIRDERQQVIGTVIEARNIEAELQARAAMTSFNASLQKRVDEVMAQREITEAQLRQAQKLEAIGKLTGGVAHDFNNLLQVIGGNLQLLVRDVAGNLRAEQRVQNAIAGVARGGKLAAQLLAFGRKQALAPKVVNLGRLVRGMDDLLRRALGDGVEVETVISGGLWNTFVDETQVENAILNLAINARDAMNGQGKLTIEAGNALLDERYARQHPDVEPGQYVMIAVTDTGSGIPGEILDEIFEPFFTTKPRGQGSGLGLSMVYGLVKQSDGHIKVYSEIGEGTTFRLYLPRIRKEEAAVEVANTGPVRGGTETILVVEDDDDVRSTVIELLSELGYRVLRAKDAASGLAIVESGVPIDLLFTDVVMPGPMQSREMARRAQERIPGIAVLFTSGYTENSIVHGGRLDEGVELLSKPYTQRDLAYRIRSLLDGRSDQVTPSVPTAHEAQKEREALKVLIVEDEVLIRLAAAEMVMDLGHAVFEAGSGKQALEILESNLINAMITDIGLPGISGTSLIAQVQERWPAIKIVVASGFAGPDSADGAGLSGDVSWISKPYGPAEIEKALKFQA